MAKLTIAEAAQHFNVSKEAIHNRIRRGTIDCIIENGVKYVVTGEEVKQTQQPAPDTKYYDYIEQENERLKVRVGELESETRSLRDQREQMLIEERIKIEQIYKERDEQLKNILQVVASKFLPQGTAEHVIDEAITGETVTAEVIEAEAEETLISLKQFLKLKGFKEDAKTAIKSRFKKSAKRGDERLVRREGKIFLDPTRHDYSDLLKV